MSFFVDTSVLIAAFWGDHPNHQASSALVASAAVGSAFCAAHSVAEVFSVMTRMPLKPPIPAEQAVLFIREIRERFSVIALTGTEYFAAIERLAALGLAKGLIYDALIMSAAAKSRAERVFTWNIDDIVLVSPPELAARIRTPAQG